MNLSNVNDRANLPVHPQLAVPDVPEQDGTSGRQEQGSLMPVTQSREASQTDLPAVTMQKPEIHSEPCLTSLDAKTGFEQRCEALLEQTTPGKLLSDLDDLLDQTCKFQSLPLLAKLMDHIDQVASQAEETMDPVEGSFGSEPVLTIALKRQWLEGVKLMLARGALLPLAVAMEEKVALHLLRNLALIDAVLPSFSAADKQRLLNRLLEVSLAAPSAVPSAAGASEVTVSPSKLVSLGADIFSRPSALLLGHWDEINFSISEWREKFRIEGYDTCLRKLLDGVGCDRLSSSFKRALEKPCPPVDLLEYACQQGQFTIVKQTLDRMSPANAKRLSRWLMFHVIGETATPKNHVEFTRLMLEKVLSVGYDEAQAILDEWLLASALYCNSDAWMALVGAGAKAGSLPLFHKDAVIDTFIESAVWSDLGFFLIRQGGYWRDGPNDGEMRGNALIKELCALDENTKKMNLLDVLTCADLLRHREIEIIQQPLPMLKFGGKPLYRQDKERGRDSLLDMISERHLPPWQWALGWRDTCVPVAILTQIEKLLPHLKVWKEMLALNDAGSEKRWQRAVLWFFGSLHENLNFGHLYAEEYRFSGKPRALLKAFAFQSACDLSDQAKARLKAMDKEWQRLPDIAIRYVQDGAIDVVRLSKRLQKLGLYEPNAVRVAHALALAYQHASGHPGVMVPQGSVSEQMSYAQSSLAGAVAAELPAALAAVSKSWSEQSSRAMPKLMERFLTLSTKEKQYFVNLTNTYGELRKIHDQNSQMLVDMVLSQFDDLLEVFGLRDPFALKRKEQAANWRASTIANIHQQWLQAGSPEEVSDDDDSSGIDDGEGGSSDDDSSSRVSSASNLENDDSDSIDDAYGVREMENPEGDADDDADENVEAEEQQ